MELKKKIGLIATARFVEKETVDLAVSFLEKNNFEVVLADNISNAYHQFASEDKERAKSLQNMLDRKDIDILWCVRGGYGSVRIIDQLDWTLFKKYPKTLIGFSDFTIFLNHILPFGFKSIHSPMPIQLPNLTEESKLSLINHLQGKKEPLNWESSLTQSEKVQGTLVGGNLSVLYSMLGSNSYPNLENSILFIEDLDEYSYHLDRMLYGMYRSGSLSQCKAILVGSFTHIHDHKIPFGEDYRKIISKFASKLKISVFFDCPVGHIDNSYSLYIGSDLIIHQKENNVSLEYEE
jgi:muramoyltetrapeptide carboxypeptidase